jgi:hypothetical protein
MHQILGMIYVPTFPRSFKPHTTLRLIKVFTLEHVLFAIGRTFNENQSFHTRWTRTYDWIQLDGLIHQSKIDNGSTTSGDNTCYSWNTWNDIVCVIS